MQITDCGQNIEWRAEVGTRGLRSFFGQTESTEVNGQRTESSVHQSKCLLLPTSLLEPASVSKHDAPIGGSIQVRVDGPSVHGLKGDGILRADQSRRNHCCHECSPDRHLWR